MQIKKKINNKNKLYIFFFSYVLFINLVFSTTLNANSFKISNLDISEPFELNFNKEKVIEKGFKKAFDELLSIITTSGDKEKIEKISLLQIKNLVDSFTMYEEKFVNNEYHTKFDVNFNKKKTLNFLEKKNIFPSIAKNKKILLIPILVDLQTDKILLFNGNIFYNSWNNKNKRYYLLDYLLPSEDLEDVNLLLQNSQSIEDYDFKDIIKKYALNDYIISIIYKNNNTFRVLSKINLEESVKIDNQKFQNINISIDEDYEKVIRALKKTYENYWKSINQINTSIKLPLTISLDSSQYHKIDHFEKILNEFDLVSSFDISKFNNKDIFFKIIFNGSPNKFMNSMKKNDIIIDYQENIWRVQ